MAEKVQVVNEFRAGIRETADNMRAVNGLLAIVEDMGVDDPARLAFLTGIFEGQENPQHGDITEAQFAAGIIALRNLRTAWATNKYAVAKLLK
jgi:hypothetical protein